MVRDYFVKKTHFFSTFLPNLSLTLWKFSYAYRFPTTYIMNQHLKNIHLNAYSKICDICGKSIRGREAFRLHQQEHAGVPKTLVECGLCGLKLTNKYGLSRHMKTVHSEENAMPQICTICSKVSPTVTAHRTHMNYVHNLERKHACPMCDKAFKRAKGLQVSCCCIIFSALL